MGRWLWALGVLLPLMATAATVDRFTPQGTARDTRQVTVRFSAAMVPFGDPRLPDPFDIDCAAGGHGRWADARTWVYDFTADLPAGVVCRFTLKSGLKTQAGAALVGQRQFSFNTGGPAIRASLPREGSASIDENQIFLVALDAPADAASVESQAYCAVTGLAERIPVKLLGGAEREAVLKQRRLLGYQYFNILWKDGAQSLAQVKDDELARAERSIEVLRCARTLPPDTQVDVVWAKGIHTPDAGGPATVRDQVLSFKTRPAFSARMECDRVNAAAPCVPVLPIRVYFSAPVAREQAAQIRLYDGERARPPEFDDQDSPFIDSLQFPAPLPPSTKLELRLPKALHDDAGRSLVNASSFPLTIPTDEAPPLAKFSGEFGILELSQGGVLPVTLRNLEDQVPAQKIGGGAKRITDEAEVLRWMKRVRTDMDSRWVDDKLEPPGLHSVFGKHDGAQAFTVDKPAGGKAFEVVGIPLREPGFYVVELASPRLGAALLGQSRPRYVATTALVTDLAVHFEWGRESSLVFVTRLDDGKPVADAALKIVDGCDGKPLWSGRSGDDGLARIAGGLPAPQAWASCDYGNNHPLMVSARSGGDFSFVLSSWNEGIQPQDFQLTSDSWRQPQIAHTVLDRALFRAGETVSMKHYWREHTAAGLAVPKRSPDKLLIEHEGSGQTYELPLQFDAQGIAVTQWPIPKEAPLGVYTVHFKGDKLDLQSAQFRVEQYRVPLMRALIQPPEQPATGARELPLNLYVGYFSGGGAGGLPVQLRTQIEPRSVQFKDYDNYSFNGEDIREGIVELGGGGDLPDDDDQADSDTHAQPGQTLPLSLDANGNAHVVVPKLPQSADAQTLVAELEYPDANGERSSTRAEIPLWPASMLVGLSVDDWTGSRERIKLHAVVVDLKGRPVAGHSVRVTSYLRITHSYRKRLVGGFYAYSHSRETRRLSAECSGRTDQHGLLSCTLQPGVAGEIELLATTSDDAGREARATRTTWVAGQQDWWFTQGDSDRMDVVPDRPEVEAGQTVALQVRMPFRSATALVSVEREGILDAFVTQLSGREPVVRLPIKDSYAPNVYVSVLAVRPRVGAFRSTLYDFLRRLHLDRWLDLHLDGGRATALVDLSKPAYRLGIAKLAVGWAPHRLQVDVRPAQDSYKIRSHASVQVQVSRASGGALPKDAEIAFSAVDEGLLDLLPNPSVNLLEAMMQTRGIDVFTSTAQMQVVGKRHYGRKSLPPGGGGGRGASREILDSLLLWKARVPLDAQGRATVDVPLNDALSAFRLTAVASAGDGLFGTGSATIRTTQDVQLLSGLPPLVREGDRYDATFTVRNTTTQAITAVLDAQVLADGTGAPVLKQQQTLQLPAGSAVPLHFALSAPAGAQRLDWSLSAHSESGELLDALKLHQDEQPVWPVRTFQATLLQLAGSQAMPVRQPADALPGRGGVRVELQSSLLAGLGGVRDWMAAYPYRCIEQRLSKAVALRDRAAWDAEVARLPGYLDRDGLVKYFPSPWLQGSDVLTAYLVALADEAGWPLPESAEARMLDGLDAFVQGRIIRGSPLDRSAQTPRKLAALDALARHQRARAEELSALNLDPGLLPSSALIDWLDLLHRVQLPKARQARAEILAQLEARLNFQGTTMSLSAEQDNGLWWLMLSADVNANRLVLALLDEPETGGELHDELPRLMRGALGRMQHGHWNLTTANAWGVLAAEKFAAAYEATPVGGTTEVKLDGRTQTADWRQAASSTLDFPWPSSAQTLHLAQHGEGRPWAIVQSRAALPLTAPLSTGYRIERELTPVEQQVPGRWTLGDVARVKLTIDAQSDMSWVVVDDPIPAGATLLGSGLGRDSALLTQGEQHSGEAWPAYEERRFDGYRAYYAFVPKGTFSVEYTLRYNTAGQFALPTTRVEAMYAPEMFGERPNEAIEVRAP